MSRTISKDVEEQVRGLSAPAHYVQGPGLFDILPEFTSVFGKRAFFLIDTFFYKEFSERLDTLYGATDCEAAYTEFGGEVTDAEIARVADLVTGFKADVVVGLGGGKTMDTSRCVALPRNIALITMPTAASTDAPTSSSAIVYKENGEHLRGELFDKNPNMVLADETIIARAPVRYLAAGMGDALATWIEGRAAAAAASPNYVYSKKFGGLKRTLTGMAIAERCFDLLMKEGRSAKIAAEAGVMTTALSDIIEVNILMSGMGFENTACAGAHSIHDGMTKVPGGTKSLHGEKVAFGSIVELICENRPMEEIEEVINFCLDIGLPVTLEDLHIEATDEIIRTIAEESMKSFWNAEPLYVTPKMVEESIKMADVLVKKIREKR